MDIFLYWCPGPIVYAPSVMGREVPWVPGCAVSARVSSACGRQNEVPRRTREKKPPVPRVEER